MADNVLGTLFGEIANSIRSKTGGTGTMKPAEFPEQIDSITASNVIDNVEIALDFSNGDLTERLPEGYSANAVTIFKPDTLIPANIAKDVNIAGIIGTHEGGGSGGSVEGTAKVTFCNYDGSFLYERLVFVGDNCANPVTQGKLDTPTRASTAQYDYTFSGWSTTQGGSASSTALSNITADKTVYAAYTASLVYYTARFYDGAKLMQESQVAYGQTATPPDVAKEGYKFVEWTPSDLTITADTDFYGTWNEATYLYALATPTGATLYKPFAKMAYTKNGERLIGIVSVSNQTKNMYIYNTTTNPYSLVTSYQTITGSGCYVTDLAMHPNGTMFVITNTFSAASSESYYRVYSVNGNTISNKTTTYYTAPSLSAYKYTKAVFNSDGTRLLLCSGDGHLVVFDTTTTPFTEIATNTSPNHSLYDAPLLVASKGDSNVIYFGLSKSTYFGKLELDTLASTSIVYTDISYRYPMLSNAQDKLYLNGSSSIYVYAFDNTTHTLGSQTPVSGIGYMIQNNNGQAISPDDKKFVRGDTTAGIKIYNLENNSFATITPPDTVITGASFYSSVAFDESGTKLAMSPRDKSPYIITYVADPSVNS